MTAKVYKIDDAPQPSDTGRANFINEFKGVFQPLRLLANYKKLTQTKIGTGQRVMLFPGWKSTESSMYPMKNFLTKLGYTVEYWGLGLNNGKVEAYRDKLLPQIEN